MDMQEILSKINAVFQDVFMDKTIQISENTTASDIDDWDSLMNITLIDEIEKAFSVKFAVEQIINFENCGDIAAAISKNI